MHKACARKAGQRPRMFAWLVSVASVTMLGGCAHLPASNSQAQAQAQRLGTLFEQALPVKHIVAKLLKEEPKWPFQHAQNITPAELACVRAEMAPEKVTVQQHEDARRYVQAHSKTVEQDIRLLESGAASAMGTLMQAGINGRSTKASLDASLKDAPQSRARDVMKTFSLEQIKSLTQLMLDPAHEDLRKAMRIDFLSGGTVDRFSARNRGVQVGASLMLPPLFAAMQKCNISPAMLQ